MVKQVRLGLIGFGNVGQGLAQILMESRIEYIETFGLDLKIVAVVDALKGSVYDPQGLDLELLLEAAGRTEGFHGVFT